MYSGSSDRLGVGAGAASLVFAQLILVDHPFQRAAVAEAVAERLRWDTRERERWVDRQRGLVLREPHLLDPIRERHAGRFDPFQ